jgi:hypothetical protein
MNATLCETIDEPMLRWVATLPPSLAMELHKLQIRKPELFPHVDGVDSRQSHESLLRLLSAELIGSDHSPTTHYESWFKLRLTARGWIVLGEWPDLDRVATAVSIQSLLRALAEDAPEEERPALLRAAGVASRTIDDVVRETLAEVAHGAGEDVAT